MVWRDLHLFHKTVSFSGNFISVMSLGQKLSSFSSASSLPLCQFPSVSIFSIILHGIPDHCHLHLNCWSGSLTLLFELGFPLSCILSVLQQYSQCHILCRRYVINALSVSRNPMVFLTFQLLSMPSLSTHRTDFLRH